MAPLIKLGPLKHNTRRIMPIIFRRANHKWQLYHRRDAKEVCLFRLFLHLDVRSRAVWVIFVLTLSSLLFAGDLSDGQFEGKCDLVSFKQHLISERCFILLGCGLFESGDFFPLVGLVEVLHLVLHELGVIQLVKGIYRV